MLRELFATLAPFRPLLVGALPLGLDDGSVTVICESHEEGAFERAVRGAIADATFRRVEPAVIATFVLDGLSVEVSAQPLATYEQTAFRGMLVEGRLLRLASDALRDTVIARRRAGASIEAAFTEALALSGDDALLALESASDADLAAVLSKAGVDRRVRATTAAASAEEGFAWSRVFTEAYSNPRMGDDELERQLDQLEIDFTMAEKINIASRVHMRVDNIRLANPVTELGLPDDVLSLFRWCNGGEFAVGERRFVPIFRMHEIRQYMIDYAVPYFMPTCIPFALDGKGNCYFIDLSTKPSSWVYFGPLQHLGVRSKFRLLTDNFLSVFLDPSDPAW